MDPLTAIGLASAIVQFVDFGRNLISESHEMYRSIEGTSKTNMDTENIAKQIHSLSEHLLSSDQSYEETGAPFENQRVLRSLATECRSVASELLDLLKDLKVDNHIRGDRRKWETFRKAVVSQTPKKKRQIGNLKRRSKAYRRK